MLASFDCIHNLKSSPYFNQMRLYASAEGMYAVNPNVAGQKRHTGPSPEPAHYAALSAAIS